MTCLRMMTLGVDGSFSIVSSNFGFTSDEADESVASILH
jgi:hypothetical protein